ncbi:MAG: N-acetylmuramoyl-L-alanine amidase [Actinomycetota bacterium]|nr:N-acetylmuramoyl-L-alanine amidase [Actinomycetota bacterium]
MTRRRALPALVVALVVYAGGAQPTAPEPEREPVPVSVQTVPLEAGSSEPVRTVGATAPFSMVGVTWSGPTPDTVELRVRQGGGWSDWEAVDAIDGAMEAADASEPVWTGPSRQVQVRAVQGDHPAPGVSVVLIDPGSEPADRSPPVTPTASGPPVISRAGWGADESLRCSDPGYDDRVKAVALHHTAGGNRYGMEDSAGIVRGVYAYHAWTLGWCDIGYHALVDRYGQVFEGRAGGLDRPVIGAHAGGFNRQTSSIAMMGRYTGEQPPRVMADELARFLDWKLGVHTLDPHGETVLVSAGGGTSRYPRGTAVPLPVLFGHRDVGATECPGDDGYALLPGLRAAAASTA